MKKVASQPRVEKKSAFFVLPVRKYITFFFAGFFFFSVQTSWRLFVGHFWCSKDLLSCFGVKKDRYVGMWIKSIFWSTVGGLRCLCFRYTQLFFGTPATPRAELVVVGAYVINWLYFHHTSSNNGAFRTYTVVKVDGDRHSQVRWRIVSGHDKPRGVAIAIYLAGGSIIINVMKNPEISFEAPFKTSTKNPTIFMLMILNINPSTRFYQPQPQCVRKALLRTLQPLPENMESCFFLVGGFNPSEKY